MKKIFVTLIISMFISLGLTSVVTGDVTLDGAIDVEVKEWSWNLVAPSINLDENQTITLNVDVETVDDTTTYFVNDTIFMDLNILQDENSERFLIFGRGIAYSAFVVRKIKPLSGDLLRGIKLLPIRKFFGSATVVQGALSGNVTEQINVSAQYTIDEDRFNNGENLTMHLFVMGMIPGDVDGSTEQIPIIDYKKINLDVNYV